MKITAEEIKQHLHDEEQQRLLESSKPHKAHWSRHTIDTVICKICHRERPNQGHWSDTECNVKRK